MGYAAIFHTNRWTGTLIRLINGYRLIYVFLFIIYGILQGDLKSI